MLPQLPTSRRIKRTNSFRSAGRRLLVARLVVLLTALSALCLPLSPAHSAPNRDAPRLAVVSDDVRSGTAVVRAMMTQPPWDWVTEPLTVGKNVVLRAKGRRLFALSRTDGTIAIINTATWSVRRTYRLPATANPLDIAVVNRKLAYVSIADSDHLLRLDLRSGATTEVLDFQPLIDDELSRPEASGLKIHDGRLFVQLREIQDRPTGKMPARLAVVDLETETFVDADPATPETQAILLTGTYGKFKMQVLPGQRRLLLSATGVFFDSGGIEAIDLDTLTSVGLVIREEDSLVGADLGAFVMVSPRRGYLAFTTDLLLSSHLHAFTAFDRPDLEELQTSLDYFMPTLVRSLRARVFFAPEGGSRKPSGIHAYQLRSGRRLTTNPTATTGPPTDLELLRGARRPS